MSDTALDFAAILADIASRTLTQRQIASKHDCSQGTVWRLAKEHGLSPGVKVKYQWAFHESTAEVSYILGAYLTDGTIGYRGKNKAPTLFNFSNTEAAFVSRVELNLWSLGLPTKRFSGPSTRKSQLPYEILGCYSSQFARWLFEVCDRKARIPAFLFDAPIAHRVAFVDGIIDGDGHVGSEGAIRLRGVDGWLRELPSLLATMGVRTTGYKVSEILKSGKEYGRVAIRREDLRPLNPNCAITAKQDRIMNGVQMNVWHPPTLKHYPCPVCGKEAMWSPDVQMCRECYLASDKFHAHLKAIASTGSKAGNLARWGTAEGRRRPKVHKLYPCPVCGQVTMWRQNGQSCRACYLKGNRFHDHLKVIAKSGGHASAHKRWGEPLPTQP